MRAARALGSFISLACWCSHVTAHFAPLPSAAAAAADREALRRAQDAANNALLLARLHGQAGRRAAFVSTLVALRHAADPEPLVACGRWVGEILDVPRGAAGFGYDPLMFIPALGRSVAELDAATKNRLSHRALAAAQREEEGILILLDGLSALGVTQSALWLARDADLILAGSRGLSSERAARLARVTSEDREAPIAQALDAQAAAWLASGASVRCVLPLRARAGCLGVLDLTGSAAWLAEEEERQALATLAAHLDAVVKDEVGGARAPSLRTWSPRATARTASRCSCRVSRV